MRVENTHEIQILRTRRFIRFEQILRTKLVTLALLAGKRIRQRDGACYYLLAIFGAAQHCSATFIRIRGFCVADHVPPRLLFDLNHSRNVR
jgi:hypothetical protein